MTRADPCCTPPKEDISSFRDFRSPIKWQRKDREKFSLVKVLLKFELACLGTLRIDGKMQQHQNMTLLVSPNFMVMSTTRFLAQREELIRWQIVGQGKPWPKMRTPNFSGFQEMNSTWRNCYWKMATFRRNWTVMKSSRSRKNVFTTLQTLPKGSWWPFTLWEALEESGIGETTSMSLFYCTC